MVQAASGGLGERLGQNAAEQTVARIEAEVAQCEGEAALAKAGSLVRRAAKAWQRGEIARTAQYALRAVEADDTHALAYHMLALALDRMGHLHKALVTYERAFELNPDEPDLPLNLGLLAWRMQMFEQASGLFHAYIARRPDSPLGYNNLGSVQYDMGDGAGAIETLRQALFRLPKEPVLWNALATILAEMGRSEEGLVFFEEAIALDPGYPRPWHNLGYALMHLGRLDEALEAYNQALSRASEPSEIREGRHSRSICLIGMGQLEEGFRENEIRNTPEFRGYVHYMVEAPAWRGEALTGKTLLISGEQGLGDEMMFASIVPDLLEAVGETGKLQIAVCDRLVPLFQRSFPQAEIGTYDDRVLPGADGNTELRFVPFASGDNRPHFYAPMGTPLQYLRKRIEDFPRQAFLRADPARVAEMRQALTRLGPGPYAGICWRSMLKQVKRQKYFSALNYWGPVFATPGVTFVNVQYGDCGDELNAAMEAFGVTVHRIEGLDLKRDIDGAAALSTALDLVISAPTAAAAAAASAGTETWYLTAGRTWPQCGTDCYPWFANAPVFSPKSFGDWPALMSDVAAALAVFARERAAA